MTNIDSIKSKLVRLMKGETIPPKEMADNEFAILTALLNRMFHQAFSTLRVVYIEPSDDETFTEATVKLKILMPSDDVIESLINDVNNKE